MSTKIAVIGFAIADAVLIGISAFFYHGEDRNAPVISFEEAELTYQEGMDETALLEGVSAADDRDGDVTGDLIVEKISETSDGKVIVTYAVMDSSNNVAKRSREYRKKYKSADSKYAKVRIECCAIYFL